MSSFSFRGLSGVWGGMSCWAGPSSFCVGASGISSIVGLLCLWRLYSSRFLRLSAFIWSLASGITIVLVVAFSNSISSIFALVLAFSNSISVFYHCYGYCFCVLLWDYAIIYP